MDHPNVVIIYGDDVGYGDVGVNGSTKIPTPYIDKIAKRFNVDFKPQETPMDAGFAMMPEDLREEHAAEEMAAMETEFRSMIGSLAFASVTVRWDIAYSVSVLSRYLMKPIAR